MTPPNQGPCCDGQVMTPPNQGPCWAGQVMTTPNQGPCWARQVRTPPNQGPCWDGQVLHKVSHNMSSCQAVSFTLATTRPVVQTSDMNVLIDVLFQQISIDLQPVIGNIHSMSLIIFTACHCNIQSLSLVIFIACH